MNLSTDYRPAPELMFTLAAGGYNVLTLDSFCGRLVRRNRNVNRESALTR